MSQFSNRIFLLTRVTPTTYTSIPSPAPFTDTSLLYAKRRLSTRSRPHNSGATGRVVGVASEGRKTTESCANATDLWLRTFFRRSLLCEGMATTPITSNLFTSCIMITVVSIHFGVTSDEFDFTLIFKSETKVLIAAVYAATLFVPS